MLGIAALMCAVAMVAAVACWRRAVRIRRPLLPVEDRPPAGLSRLVPVGHRQWDREIERGLHALSRYLAERGRR